MALGAVKLGTWLASIAAPLAKKVLVGLGIGWLTYEGVSVAMQAVENQVIAQWGGMPADVLAVVGLWGFTDAVGIILGGMAMRVTIVVTSRLGKLAE